MTEPQLNVHCPVQESPTPDLEGFAPLLDRLRSAELLLADETFPRGTLRRDGRLDLCKQEAGVPGCAAVTAALRHNSAVQSLLLGTNGIGDEGAGHVAELIRVRPLRTVYLGCNLIGAPGTAVLAEAVGQQPQVRALWLKRNPIGPEGARTLAAMLRRNRTLRTLDVVNTGIGDAGARELLRALAEENTTLQHLYLSGNALTPAILPEVASVLDHHPALRGLYLSVNAFGNDTGLLAEAVARNRTLTSLGLASCDLGDTALSTLLDAACTSRVQFLDLGDAPSARALGTSPNRAGLHTQAAVRALFEQPGPLSVLNLPRVLFPASLLTLCPPRLTLRITGQKVAQGQADLPFHPDAADIRSVYR
ncbi:hypothetical protein [Deinococcus altitudinis]|uniref:hypothetical protein n=1 Tax=Deinococcus altitudinis TaxID=468914 RepID=UPI0038920C5C